MLATLWVILAAVVIGSIVAFTAKRLRRASDTERETQLLTRLEEIAALALFNTSKAEAELGKIGDDELRYFQLDRSMGIEVMIATLRDRRRIRQVANGTHRLAPQR